MPAFHEPHHILIIPLRFLGDTVLTTPLIAAVRQRFPQAILTVLCSKTAAPLLENNPHLNHIAIEARGLSRQLQQFKHIAPDTALILRKSITTALLLKLAGVPWVVGYDKQRWFAPLHYKRWGMFLNHKVRYPSLKTLIPQARSHLQFLEALPDSEAAAVTPQLGDDAPTLYPAEAHRQQLQATLAQYLSVPITPETKIAVFHGVSASHGKGVAAEKFIPALNHLATAGFTIVATGIASDEPFYTALQQQGAPIVGLAGKTHLMETVALLERAHLLLSVDSAPLHMAAAVKTPVIVGVFGPTNVAQWGHGHYGPSEGHSRFIPVALPLDCRPCYAKVCEHNRCKTDITPDMIVAAVQQGLEGLGVTTQDSSVT